MTVIDKLLVKELGLSPTTTAPITVSGIPYRLTPPVNGIRYRSSRHTVYHMCGFGGYRRSAVFIRQWRMADAP